MSQILDIVKAIGLVSVETASTTPVVFGVENAMSSARKVPARFIFPVQLETAEGTTTYKTIGSNPVLEHMWTVYDLMLFHSASNTSSKLQFMPELVSYAANYKTAFKSKANQKLGLQHVTIEEIVTEWDDYTFPPKSNNDYHGVLVQLTIKEIEQ